VVDITVVAAGVRFALAWFFAGAAARVAVCFLAGAGGVLAIVAFPAAFTGTCLTVGAVDVAAPRADRHGAVGFPDPSVAVRARAGRATCVVAGRGVALRARPFGAAGADGCSAGSVAVAASRAGAPCRALSAAVPEPRPGCGPSPSRPHLVSPATGQERRGDRAGKC